MRILAAIFLIIPFMVACTLSAEPDAVLPSTGGLAETGSAVTEAPLSEQPTGVRTETVSNTAPPPRTPVSEWKPGWLFFEYDKMQFSFRVAYPRAWRVEVDHPRPGEIRFQSPESGSTILITIFAEGFEPETISTEWVTWAKENQPRVIPFLLDTGSRPEPEVNTRYLERDAIFVSSTGRLSGLGTQACMLFPDGEAVYRIYLHGADWLEAEREIYQTMLRTFTLSNGKTDSDYTVPRDAWPHQPSAVDAISGTVFEVIPEERLIVLDTPAMGFITVTLEPSGTLITSNGETMVWDDISPGMSLRAEGQAGEAGNYLAQRISIHQ